MPDVHDPWGVCRVNSAVTRRMAERESPAPARDSPTVEETVHVRAQADVLDDDVDRCFLTVTARRFFRLAFSRSAAASWAARNAFWAWA